MTTALAVAPEIGLAPACRALGVSRASAYRHRSPKLPVERPSRPKPALALSDDERTAVLAQLHSERFMDSSPAQVYATLLDEGTYLASERTMYRILARQGETGERRAQLRHPVYAVPELLATGPNQLWSWAEPVKPDETRRHVMLCPSTSLGWLIQAGPGRAGGSVAC